MEDKKLVAAIDVETTGLVKGKHEIIEIACIICDIDLVPFNLFFKSYIKPVNIALISPKAMEINKIDLNMLLKSAPTSSQVRSEFIMWKNELFGDTKLQPLGHNFDGFDKGFLELWLGDIYTDIFDHHSMDSCKVARICKDIGILPVERCNLPTLKDHFAINIGKLHSAYGDCLITIEIYRQLVKLLKSRLK
jgi:DNA polymerase III epsilon subunit-like protein